MWCSRPLPVASSRRRSTPSASFPTRAWPSSSRSCWTCSSSAGRSPPTDRDSDRRAARERLEFEEELPELHGCRVLDVNGAHDPLDLGLDLVHELHGFQDAERLA